MPLAFDQNECLRERYDLGRAESLPDAVVAAHLFDFTDDHGQGRGGDDFGERELLQGELHRFTGE